MCTYHIRIVKVSRAGLTDKVVFISTVHTYNTLQTIPRVLDVSCVPPDVTVLGNLSVIRLQEQQPGRGSDEGYNPLSLTFLVLRLHTHNMNEAVA